MHELLFLKFLISSCATLNVTKRKKCVFKRRWSAWMETNWVCRRKWRTNGQEMLLIVYVPDRKRLSVCVYLHLSEFWNCDFKHCTLSIDEDRTWGILSQAGIRKKGKKTLKNALISFVLLLKMFEKIFCNWKQFLTPCRATKGNRNASIKVIQFALMLITQNRCLTLNMLLWRYLCICGTYFYLGIYLNVYEFLSCLFEIMFSSIFMWLHWCDDVEFLNKLSLSFYKKLV